MASLVNSTKYLKKNWYQSFSNSSQKKRRRAHFQTHSIRTFYCWYQNQTRTLQENYRPIAWLKIGAKFMNIGPGECGSAGLEHCPTHWKVVGLIQVRAHPGWGFDSWLGCILEATNRCFSFSLPLSLPVFLKSVKTCPGVRIEKKSWTY